MSSFTAADSTPAIAAGAAYTGQVNPAERVAAVTSATSGRQQAASSDTVVLSSLALEALGDLGATGAVSSTALEDIVQTASRFADGSALLAALDTPRSQAVALLQATPQPTVTTADTAALLMQATRLAGMEQMLAASTGVGVGESIPLFPALAATDTVSLLLQALADGAAEGTASTQGGTNTVPAQIAAQLGAAASSSTAQALAASQESTQAAVAALLPVLLENVALHDEPFLSSVFFASGLRPSVTLPGLMLSGSALTSVAMALESALTDTSLSDVEKAALQNAFTMLQADALSGGAVENQTGGLYAPPALYHPPTLNWPVYNQVSQGALALPEGPAALAASMTMEAVAFENAVMPGVLPGMRRHDGVSAGDLSQGLPLSSLEEMGRSATGVNGLNNSLALAALMPGLSDVSAEMEAASFSNAMLNSTALTSVINAGWTVLLSGYQFRLYPPFVRRRPRWWRRHGVWRTAPANPSAQDGDFYGGSRSGGGYTA